MNLKKIKEVMNTYKKCIRTSEELSSALPSYTVERKVESILSEVRTLTIGNIYVEKSDGTVRAEFKSHHPLTTKDLVGIRDFINTLLKED